MTSEKIYSDNPEKRKKRTKKDIIYPEKVQEEKGKGCCFESKQWFIEEYFRKNCRLIVFNKKYVKEYTYS